MKFLHLDWTTFLNFLDPWHALPPAAQRFLLDVKPKTVMPRSAAGSDLAALLSGRFLRALSDGKRVEISDAFHDPCKALRALARHPLLEKADKTVLRGYLTDHFTNEERRPLHNSPYGDYGDHDAFLIETITSAAHVRGFLHADDRSAWERERLPASRGRSSERAWTQTEPLLGRKSAGADVACLLETLVAANGPIPMRALPERLASVPRARLAHALEAGLRYLLCFAALDAELEPVLLLWPTVAERLARIPAPPPPSVEPAESFCLPFAVEDLTQLLVRAAEPLRMKADGWHLFAAVERELERGLLPLPAWLMHPQLFSENAPGQRIRAALELAEALGFVAPHGKRGRDLGLVTSPAGWKWLDLEPRGRLKAVVDLFRPRPERARRTHARVTRRASADEDLFGEPSEEIDELHELEELLDEVDEDVLVPFDGRRARRALVISDEALFGAYESNGLARAALGAYAEFQPGRAVLFSAFLRYHAESSNPFLSPELAREISYTHAGRRLTEEQLEDLWVIGLQRIFHRYLLPLGGARAGVSRENGFTVELTAAGRYLLGLADDFALEAAPHARTPARVQPDFEIVFVSANPALEAAISRFAERRGTGVGVLFRITRASILQAAQSGLGAEEVLATLAGGGSTSVPANVEHEIRAWFASCRNLRLEPVFIVRCPDAATAARVLAAGGGKLEALSDTVLALTDPAHKAAVTRACRKAGLFLRAATPVRTTASR